MSHFLHLPLKLPQLSKLTSRKYPLYSLLKLLSIKLPQQHLLLRKLHLDPLRASMPRILYLSLNPSQLSKLRNTNAHLPSAIHLFHALLRP